MKTKVVFCHFSFRRPRGKDYSIFACALYSDFDGKKIIARRTCAYKMWEDHQHITAIQSYNFALECLFEWKYKLLKYGVTNVLLVTNNSTLEGWILNTKKNKNYAHWMIKACEHYSVGASKDLELSVGVCEARDYEKSHKFCKEELVENEMPVELGNNTEIKLKLSSFKSMSDVLDEDKPKGLEGIQLIG